MKSKQDIQELMEVIFKELQSTREAGQKEYAHDSQNAFTNFEDAAKDLQTSREKVLWTFVDKHLRGIKAYINGHFSQREDVRGRIKDVMVYLILLWGMVEDNADGTLRSLDELRPRDPGIMTPRGIEFKEIDTIGQAISLLERNGYECRFNPKDFTKKP